MICRLIISWKKLRKAYIPHKRDFFEIPKPVTHKWFYIKLKIELLFSMTQKAFVQLGKCMNTDCNAFAVLQFMRDTDIKDRSLA